MAGYKAFLKQLGYDASVPMEGKIAEWNGWYTADNDWYSSTETSTDGRTYKVERLSIKPARMVCQEWASLLLNERTAIATDDDSTNEWLNSYFGNVFFPRIQGLVERVFALGTGAIVLRVENIDPNSAFSPGARIVAQRFDARQIIPLSYDEDTCTECAFVSKVVIGSRQLDQLQMHRIRGGRYVIETQFFDAHGTPHRVEGVAPEFVTTSRTPMFALLTPGLENTYWDYGPFGVSVFDDALGAVKLVDTAIDNSFRDIWLGQKMLFLDERMMQTDKDGNVVVPRAKDQQLFRKTEADQGSMIEEYNPDLRVSDNRQALITALEVLGQRTGMGSDYFSLDTASGVKTATEVVAEQSDLFRSVRKHENSLAPALQTVVAGILSLARDVLGAPVAQDYGEIRVMFDDSVIEDADAQRKRDLADVAAGLMQPYEYRMRWYGEDEKTARAMVEGEELPPSE